MSLDPTWASTMFGVYAFAGSMISALCTIGLAAHPLQRAGYLKGVITVENYHDLGKLQFGFIVFWAYIAFSQFMLIWYANLPEETAWFRLRWRTAGRRWRSRCASSWRPFGMLSCTAKRNAGHDDGGRADSGHALRRSVLGHHAGSSAQPGSDGA